MNNLHIDLTNCFGIDRLEHDFDFTNGQAFAVYARNGLMKTSLAKTFQLIQRNRQNDIGDKIFHRHSTATVTIDNQPISRDQVFVIKSYENSYESDISPLLVNRDIQRQLTEVLRLRTELLNALESASGVKIQKTSQGKKVYELEPKIIEDFGFVEKSILLNLDALLEYDPELQCAGINYSDIFDPSVLKKIQNQRFQSGIQNFTTATDRIYESYLYLEKGHFTLPKLKDLKNALVKDSFFVRNNSITLSGQEAIANSNALESHIATIETQIQQMPEYRAIEALLSDAKGIVLKDIIENHPEIIEFLSIENLPTLKKCLWSSYIKNNLQLFEQLRAEYNALTTAIDAIPLDDTPWKHALDIFNKRFSVPFSMSISNLKGAIIGESVPQVKFTFSKGTDTVTIDRNELEELDTLSQGEKRALYLLNIIFDIERLKAEGREVLLIIDDIADSFDYKNKYAIIEYLYEIAQDNKFYMLILTHNFDFYRTVSDRLDLDRQNRITANNGNAVLSLEQEHYQNQPFTYWKQHPTEKNVLALIPFVRNIIEYGRERNVNNNGTTDKLLLTSLLHEKADSNSITFRDILPLYQEYCNVRQFDPNIIQTDTVLSKLYSVCGTITDTDTQLENKIILAIAIRHKAELFMKREISGFAGQLNWMIRGQNHRGTNTDFLNYVETTKNQTRSLFNGYCQFGINENIFILNEVNIMTPEHIHLNSFMYEPLLDMDITELLGLYRRVTAL